MFVFGEELPVVDSELAAVFEAPPIAQKVAAPKGLLLADLRKILPATAEHQEAEASSLPEEQSDAEEETGVAWMLPDKDEASKRSKTRRNISSDYNLALKHIQTLHTMLTQTYTHTHTHNTHIHICTYFE